MRISTEIESIAARVGGEAKAIEMLAAAGFPCYDLSLCVMGLINWGTGTVIHNGHPLEGRDGLAYVKELRRVADAAGIVCNQSHAPFPVSCREIREMLPRALEYTAEAGGKICIIHPDNLLSAEKNAEMYYELLPIAQSFGVKIATENMWGWNREEDHAVFAACATPADFIAHIDTVNSPDLVACLDIGHAEMRGLGTSAPEMIRALGSRLQAIHLHDNDCWHDSHELPFTMQIDFAPVADALRSIGYAGDITLEANAYFPNHRDVEPTTLIADMAAAARRFAAMVETPSEA